MFHHGGHVHAFEHTVVDPLAAAEDITGGEHQRITGTHGPALPAGRHEARHHTDESRAASAPQAHAGQPRHEGGFGGVGLQDVGGDGDDGFAQLANSGQRFQPSARAAGDVAHARGVQRSDELAGGSHDDVFDARGLETSREIRCLAGDAAGAKSGVEVQNLHRAESSWR